MPELQWYPGHMAKAKRTLEENLRLVNVVIELCDARLPFSSRNPEIDRIIGNKPRVLVFNKADLADPEKSDYWMNYYRNLGYTVVFTDAKAGDGVKKVIDAVYAAMEEKIAREKEKGRKTTTLYAMIVGIPNVGKSSFINRVAGRAVAVTGDKPGVTREKQWLKMGEDIYLLDTPGMLWPKIENQKAALRLAASGAIRDAVIDVGELCAFLLAYIESHYPGALEKRYGIDPGALKDDEEEYDYITSESVLDGGVLRRGLLLLDACGRARGCLLKGGDVDVNRASAVILDEFRGGKIGRISLDFPEVIAEDAEIRRQNRENAARKETNRAERKAKYKSRKR